MAKTKNEAEKTGDPATPGGAQLSDESALPSSTTPSIEDSESAGDPAVSGDPASDEIDEPRGVPGASPAESSIGGQSNAAGQAKQGRAASEKPTPAEIEAATPKPGEPLVGDSILKCLACDHEALSVEFPTAPLGSNHAWTCPICGSTNIDTSQIARAWALKGPRVFPYGNTNTIG